MFLGMNTMAFDQFDNEKSVDLRKTLMEKEKVKIFGNLGIYWSLEKYRNVGNSSKIEKLGNFGVFWNFWTLGFLGTDRIKKKRLRASPIAS